MSKDRVSQDIGGRASQNSSGGSDQVSQDIGGRTSQDSGDRVSQDIRDSGGSGGSGGYTPADPTGANNYYAKSEDHGNMSAADQETLASYGREYNEAKARGDTAGMEAAHEAAETLRGRYGYSGGGDGSEYISDGGARPQVQQLTAQAPDFTGLLDSWLATAKKQQELGIDYATQKGVNDLQRAEEDAQEQFQTQQNQIDRNEAKALDNQALYAEARGDRGGIGEAQYAQIQATAMENRRAVNSARVKLSTDTARQIADLRAQGEFQKADALLQLTQTYLGQLVDLQKWGAEYTLDINKFNAQLVQWQAEFEEDARRWNLEFDYTTSTKDQSMLAESGLAALAVGVRPSAAQQAAMGYTDAQIDAELAAFKLAQSAGIKYVAGGGDDSAGTKTRTDLYAEMYAAGVTNENDAYEYFRNAGYSAGDAERYVEEYLTQLSDDSLRDSLYDGLGASAKEVLSSIQRQNSRTDVKGITSGQQAKLEEYLTAGKISESELNTILTLLGY